MAPHGFHILLPDSHMTLWSTTEFKHQRFYLAGIWFPRPFPSPAPPSKRHDVAETRQTPAPADVSHPKNDFFGIAVTLLPSLQRYLSSRIIPVPRIIFMTFTRQLRVYALAVPDSPAPLPSCQYPVIGAIQNHYTQLPFLLPRTSQGSQCRQRTPF